MMTIKTEKKSLENPMILKVSLTNGYSRAARSILLKLDNGKPEKDKKILL